MSHDRLDINPGDTVEVDFGPGKPKIHFVVKAAHNYLDHKDADDSWIMETSEGYTWQQEVDGGTVRILRKAGDPTPPAGKKFHRQSIDADPKAAHRNDPMPVYKTLNTGLDARYSAMLVKLSGHELDDQFTQDWFETLYSLMQAALGASNEPVGEWAPLFANVLDKYDQLLAEPALGWHDGFGNQ